MSSQVNTTRPHRVLKSRAERVYRASLDADAYAQWIPPHGFTREIHSMNPTAGGKFKMSFTNFATEKSQGFGGEYLKLNPGKFIELSEKFDDSNVPEEMTVIIFL